MARAIVALTAAAPQQAEEEEERSRLHCPQSQQRGSAAARAGFPSFPPSREQTPPAGAVSFWPPAPSSVLLKLCRNRPREHWPRDLHDFQPEGYFQREFSDFLPSSALAQHPAPQPRAVPAAPNPGEPLARRVPAWLQGHPSPPPGSPARAPAPHDAAEIPSLPWFSPGSTVPPPEPLANQPLPCPSTSS